MSYQRNNTGVKEDDVAFPKFFRDKVENAVKSAAAGITVFDDVEKVTIITPGSRDQWSGFVTNEHRERWPQHYARFKADLEQTPDGFPLKLWPGASPGQAAMLEQIGCFTVQQLAQLPDASLQRIGMGAMALRTKAQAYLNDAVKGEELSKALAENDALKRQMEALQANYDDLAAKVASIAAKSA